MKVGIPRALLYHYYDELWLEFFALIGVEVVVSPPTNKEIAREGIVHSIDEACYSSKLFIGHVNWLLDRCDLIFVPRIENTGIREEYCTRIFGLYDVVANTFPEAKLLDAEVNYLFRKRTADAFVHIGTQLGISEEESLAAYKQARDKAAAAKVAKIEAQVELLEQDGLKILLAAHAYNSYDAGIGAEIVSFFDKQDIKVAFAEVIDSKEAKRIAKSYSQRVYWKVSADMLGGIEKYKDKVDGIVLVSTFPCGPDSLFSELIIRTMKELPVLSLIIDEHDASAGIQTRLESFCDIMVARKEGGLL
jgi:predicted nucleotide-binding protein (sugar kinase/HSP70/actin superfamily)